MPRTLHEYHTPRVKSSRPPSPVQEHPARNPKQQLETYNNNNNDDAITPIPRRVNKNKIIHNIAQNISPPSLPPSMSYKYLSPPALPSHPIRNKSVPISDYPKKGRTNPWPMAITAFRIYNHYTHVFPTTTTTHHAGSTLLLRSPVPSGLWHDSLCLCVRG